MAWKKQLLEEKKLGVVGVVGVVVVGVAKIGNTRHQKFPEPTAPKTL